MPYKLYTFAPAALTMPRDSSPLSIIVGISDMNSVSNMYIEPR